MPSSPVDSYPDLKQRRDYEVARSGGSTCRPCVKNDIERKYHRLAQQRKEQEQKAADARGRSVGTQVPFL